LANKGAAKADVEMKDETEALDSAPPKRKAPPNIGKKPEPRASAPKTATVTKAPTGPKIEEENLGSGLDKEEAIAKV